MLYKREQLPLSTPDYDEHILTPEESAEIDRDLDRMEANLAEQLRKRERKAA